MKYIIVAGSWALAMLMLCIGLWAMDERETANSEEMLEAQTFSVYVGIERQSISSLPGEKIENVIVQQNGEGLMRLGLLTDTGREVWGTWFGQDGKTRLILREYDDPVYVDGTKIIIIGEGEVEK